MECSERIRNTCRKYHWCGQVLAYVVLFQGLDESHGLPHTIRVLCNALYLANKIDESVDEEALVLAALLHDIGRGFEEEVGVHHALLSAELARPILGMIGINRDKAEEIIRMIVEHSFSLGGKPSSLESCILSDADKLDALGAIGVYRLIETSSQRGRTIGDTLAHVWDKLVKLPSLMCTDEARRLAKRKAMILEEFIKELLRDALLYEDSIASALDEALEALEKLGKGSKLTALKGGFLGA